MAVDIILPNLGFDMTEGTIVTWLKQVGDPVARGELLADIETDKATVQIESTAEGVLLEHVCPEGETVQVGAVIARVGQPGERS